MFLHGVRFHAIAMFLAFPASLFFVPAANAELTVNYTGKNFDPNFCQDTQHVHCLTGPITENITFPTLASDYTGNFNEENAVIVNSVAVDGALHMPPELIICETYASFTFIDGKVVFANLYITQGDNASDCNRRQVQINSGSIDQAAIYYNDFQYREFGEIDGGNGDWETQGPSCGDERDQIIAEYRKYKVVSVDGDPFVPDCGDFTKSAHSQLFSFKQLNTGDYSWALIRGPLVSPAGSPGLDEWAKQIGRDVTITSAYRNPKRNFSIYKKHGEKKKFTHGSRHMLGDGVDILNRDHTLEEYKKLLKAAMAAGADWWEDAEGKKGPCKLQCFHADWRNHNGAYQK